MEVAMLLGFALMLYIAWCIGANDASNPTECAVGAGALNLRKALILFSAFVAVGSVAQGWMVMKTFGGGVSELRSIYDALAASLSTGAWITAASLLGMPISTTHSAVGSVLGVGLAHLLVYGRASIRYDVVLRVVVSWITSPLGSIALAALLYLALRKLYTFSTTRMGVPPDRVDRLLRYALIAALAFSAYSFGANDVGNATGVYLAFLRLGGGAPSEGVDVAAAVTLASVGALGIALGGLTVGKRVVATVAYRITKLDLVSGVAGELANALVVWLFTTLPYMMFGYGMPVSTTHASVSAVIGVGLAKGGSRMIDAPTVLKIVASWLLTVPLCAGMALGLRILVHALFHV